MWILWATLGIFCIVVSATSYPNVNGQLIPVVLGVGAFVVAYIAYKKERISLTEDKIILSTFFRYKEIPIMNLKQVYTARLDTLHLFFVFQENGQEEVFRILKLPFLAHLNDLKETLRQLKKDLSVEI